MVRYSYAQPAEKPHKYSVPVTDTMLCTNVKSALIQFKVAQQTARPLKNLSLKKAEKYLNDVLKKKQCVPVTFKKTRRTAQANSVKGTKKGRWPVKVTNAYLELLENLKNEAEKKGYESEDVILTHVQVNQAPIIYGRMHRAFGQVTAKNKKPCHIEIAAEYKPKGEKLN